MRAVGGQVKREKKMKNWRDKYDSVGDFFDGRAWVRIGKKWGHVDENGDVTTPIEYDSVGSFYRGRAWVLLNEKWGRVDKQGKELE